MTSSKLKARQLSGYAYRTSPGVPWRRTVWPPVSAGIGPPLPRASSSRNYLRHQVFDDDEDIGDSDWTSDSDDVKKTSKRKQSWTSHRVQETPHHFTAPMPTRKNQISDSSDDERDDRPFDSAPTSKLRAIATDEVGGPQQRPSPFVGQSSTSDDLFGGSTSTPMCRVVGRWGSLYK
ncbi:hypothetical protein PF004_g29518 [Phytophthora fragariae]|uniref:Uncharacterized protein n=1 Tax=Phytophthora fragariae TaxID=53985 RepID=A0A6G0MF95_9STRA|nr:hypothetical protein PF004_g29518 [Phytophthora fragariae]